jgi:hypothetical protein
LIEAKLAGIIRCVANAPDRTRNSLTFWAYNRILDMEVSGEIDGLTARAAFTDIASAAISRGLPEVESMRTVRLAGSGGAPRNG